MHTSRGRTVYPVSRAIPTHAPRQLANSLLADCIAPQTLAIFRMYFRLVGDNPRMSERPLPTFDHLRPGLRADDGTSHRSFHRSDRAWADGRKAVPRTPTQRRAAIECLGGIVRWSKMIAHRPQTLNVPQHIREWQRHPPKQPQAARTRMLR